MAGAATAQSSSTKLEELLAGEIERFVEADRLAPPAPCQVLFIGSSSIARWKDRLAADMAPMPVLNRGFGGSQIEHVNRWFAQIVAPYRPRSIVFYAGENDLAAGKSVGSVVAEFDSFMARKVEALGKAPVYFIALKPSKLRFSQLNLQNQVNEAIRARAAERSDLHYIDVATPMLENGKPKDVFGPDDLHMVPSGYAIWKEVVRAALLPNSDAEARECQQAHAAGKSRTPGQSRPSIVIDADATVRLPALTVPFSSLASEEARRNLLEAVDKERQVSARKAKNTLEYRYANDDIVYRPGVERLRARFNVDIAAQKIGGVPAEVISPAEGVSAKNTNRVLINLHGGGFFMGGVWGGQMESIPIASLGRIKVISVDYRQGPEHRFPAASEDVARVYRELLKQHRPGNIGMYGCSAGGWLTAESVAWFQQHDLPRPGAIGIFGAGAMIFDGRTGDSAYTSFPLSPYGAFSGPPLTLGYFDVPGLDMKGPLVAPVYWPAVLAKFPPTLVITGTRDFLLSQAVYTHAQLTKARVDASLHVWEGTQHCSFAQRVVDPEQPETREAWDVIVRFFESKLGVS